MLSVGLDVHDMQSTFCVLDHNGKKLQNRTVHGRSDKVLSQLAQIKEPFAICFEASTGYGYLYERLAQISERVVVGHPGHLRLIFNSQRKNDRIDAGKLAKLLYLDAVPPVHVPPQEVRAWRSMIRHRSNLVAERTRAKNALRALLRGLGIVPVRSLWSTKGRRWLRDLPLPTGLDAVRRDTLLERIESIDRMIRRVEKELNRIGRHHPGVVLLRTIPGVGMRTAEAVVAYMDDPRRFARNKAVGSYFGLVPCEDSSAGRERLGHITGQGPSIARQLLVEAAWQAVRRSEKVRGVFQRIAQGDTDRRKIAIVATAHYLVRCMHAMLLRGEGWCDSTGPTIVAGQSRTLRLRRSSLTARRGRKVRAEIT